MTSLKTTGRIAAILILLMAVIAPFSMLYVPSLLVVPGDAAATATNLIASEGLFRLSIASDAVVFLIEIVLVVLLYVLLEPVSRTLSLVAAASRLAMTVVQGVNLLNHFVVLVLLSGAGYLKAFAPEQLQALVLTFLDAHEAVTLIWGLFFGLHLMVLGYLVYRSNDIPKVLGMVLMTASVCYLTQSFGIILLPEHRNVFTSIGALSAIEIALPLWLLIKGVNPSNVMRASAQKAALA